MGDQEKNVHVITVKKTYDALHSDIYIHNIKFVTKTEVTVHVTS